MLTVLVIGTNRANRCDEQAGVGTAAGQQQRTDCFCLVTRNIQQPVLAEKLDVDIDASVLVTAAWTLTVCCKNIQHRLAKDWSDLSLLQLALN